MLAVDFQALPGVDRAASDVAEDFFFVALDFGLLVNRGQEASISLSPPLIIEQRELDHTLDIVEEVMGRISILP